ncbi:MAG: hypothetical protein HYV19_01145 [Gemmatimonadetes bacterium]|nr:hypothetical protein [Gemmatimonadota bacterium]
MKSHQLYCSACDRQVKVMISEAPLGEHQATLHDDELVCLEIGDHCNGSLCPLGAAEPQAMVSRLIHSGEKIEGLKTVKGHGPACDLEADFILFGKGKASCSVCGTAARWVAEHVEPM